MSRITLTVVTIMSVLLNAAILVDNPVLEAAVCAACADGNCLFDANMILTPVPSATYTCSATDWEGIGPTDSDGCIQDPQQGCELSYCEGSWERLRVRFWIENGAQSCENLVEPAAYLWGYPISPEYPEEDEDVADAYGTISVSADEDGQTGTGWSEYSGGYMWLWLPNFYEESSYSDPHIRNWFKAGFYTNGKWGVAKPNHNRLVLEDQQSQELVEWSFSRTAECLHQPAN